MGTDNRTGCVFIAEQKGLLQRAAEQLRVAKDGPQGEINQKGSGKRSLERFMRQ
jgi:hypothetical protein